MNLAAGLPSSGSSSGTRDAKFTGAFDDVFASEGV